MNNNGYIKLDRKILTWRWYSDVNTFRVFVHLLLTANYSEGEYLTHKIKRGQLVTGRKNLSNQLKITEQQVRTALSHLVSTNEITITPHSKFSIITINNYEKYQQSTNKITNNQPTSNQQVTNNQPQYKKNKKNKKNKNIHSAKTECESVLKLYNSICTNLPRAIKLTDSRAEGIQRALVEGVDFKAVFEKVNSSDFLTGKKTGWSGCNLDWILQPENLLKIQEGCYKTYQQDSRYSFNGQAQYSDSDKIDEHLRLFESKSLFTD